MREGKDVFERQRVYFALTFAEQTEWRRISKNTLLSDQTLEVMSYRPAFSYYCRIVVVTEKMEWTLDRDCCLSTLTHAAQ